jgi:hypothetical protein
MHRYSLPRRITLPTPLPLVWRPTLFGKSDSRPLFGMQTLASVWEEDSALVCVPEPSPISNAETASVSGLDAGVVCLEECSRVRVWSPWKTGRRWRSESRKGAFGRLRKPGWWEGQGLVVEWPCTGLQDGLQRNRGGGLRVPPATRRLQDGS